MSSINKDENGVSPVIGIILMVAITIILIGVAAIWFFAFGNEANNDDDAEIYIFNVKLDGGDDTITFSVVSGDILNTTKMILRIDDVQIDVPYAELHAGSDMVIDTQMDLNPGSYYNVKITVNNKLFYDNDLVASP